MIIFVAACAVQGLIWIFFTPAGEPEGDYDYVRVTNEYLGGNVTNTFKPPLYSIFLLPMMSDGEPGWILFLVQMLFFAASTVLTDLFCERLGISQRVSFLAICLEQFYPYYAFSFLRVSDVVLNLLFIKCLVISYPDSSQGKIRYFLFGLLVGLYSYLRPNVYFILPAFVLFELYLHRYTVLRFLQRYLSIAAGIFLVILPWVLWTWNVNGSPSLTTTNGGYNLLVGNNRFASEFIGQRKFPTPEYVVWQHPEMFCRDWNAQTECEKRNRENAVQYILENPGEQPALIWLKFLRYWDIFLPDDNPPVKKIAYTVPFILILVAGLAGLIRAFRKNRDAIILLAGIQIFHMLPFLLYFSTIRMRIHLDFILMIGAGFLASEIYHRLRGLQDA